MSGMYPNAHPTAPGGMSQQALADELRDKHGWSNADLGVFAGQGKTKWNLRAWSNMIEAVCKERLNREKEQKMNEPDKQPLVLFIGMPDTLDYIFDGHAGASPSGAERWMHCTASLGASREFLETLSPNQQRQFAEGSQAARQGTTAHKAAEIELSVVLGLIDQETADAGIMDLTFSPPDGEEYDDDMEQHVSVYTDYVQSFIDEGRTVEIEQRLSAVIGLTGDYEDEVYEIKGSGDCVVYPDDEGILHVIDYKHGEGLDVSVDENPQVRIYGLGALDLLTDDEGNLTAQVNEVHYHIVQPRTTGIKVWTETLDDLLDWRDNTLAPALTASLYGPEAGAEYVPSDETCQWCPAKGSCAALAEFSVAQGRDLFDEILSAEMETGEDGAFPETSLLSDERLGELLTQANVVVKAHEALKEEAQRRLHRGVDVPGHRLVNYQPPRVWAKGAEEEFAEYEDLWTSKFMTPTQALAVLKQAGNTEMTEVAESWIEKPQVKPVISTGPKDRRKTWEGVPPEQMFADEGEA